MTTTTPKPLPWAAYATFRKRYTRATELVDILLEGYEWHSFAKCAKNDQNWQKYKFLVKSTHHAIERSKFPCCRLDNKESKGLMEELYCHLVRLWDSMGWKHCPGAELLNRCVVHLPTIMRKIDIY